MAWTYEKAIKHLKENPECLEEKVYSNIVQVLVTNGKEDEKVDSLCAPPELLIPI